MMYKYYFSAIQCDRFGCNFIKNCDLGIDEWGIQVSISFITNKKPTKKNTRRLVKILEKSKQEKSLEKYLTHVKFIKAEIVMED